MVLGTYKHNNNTHLKCLSNPFAWPVTCLHVEAQPLHQDNDSWILGHRAEQDRPPWRWFMVAGQGWDLYSTCWLYIVGIASNTYLMCICLHFMVWLVYIYIYIDTYESVDIMYIYIHGSIYICMNRFSAVLSSISWNGTTHDMTQADQVWTW